MSNNSKTKVLVIALGIIGLIFLLVAISLIKPPLKIEGIDPKEDPEGAQQYAPVQQITVKFNKEVSPDKIQVAVEPQIQLIVVQGATNKEVRIYPLPPLFWQPDEKYTITILNSSSAIDGTTLEKEIKYEIKTSLEGNYIEE